MKDDTHYITYNNIVEKGYDSEFETSLEYDEDKNNFLYPHIHNDQFSKPFSYDQVYQADKSSIETSTSQNLHFKLISQRLKKSNEDIYYQQKFAGYSEGWHDEKYSEKILSATLTSTAPLEENGSEVLTCEKILCSLANTFQTIKHFFSSEFDNIEKTSAAIIIDMLTLVVFIVLLKRWLQFDVLGHDKERNCEWFLRESSSHRKSRYNSRKKPNLDIEYELKLNNSKELLNCNQHSRFTISSNHQLIKAESRSNSISQSSDYDEESLFEITNSLEISITDEVSSLCSSSLSLDDKDDLIDSEESYTDNENDDTYKDSSQMKFYNNQESDRFIRSENKSRHSERSINNSSNSGLAHFSENNEGVSGTDKEENVITSSSNCENDDSSECSWFNEYYPKERRCLPLLNPIQIDSTFRFSISFIDEKTYDPVKVGSSPQLHTPYLLLNIFILGQMLGVRSETQLRLEKKKRKRKKKFLDQMMMSKKTQKTM